MKQIIRSTSANEHLSPRNFGLALRPKLIELPFIFAAVVLPLNQTVLPEFLGSESTKLLSIALVTFTICLTLTIRADTESATVDKPLLRLLSTYTSILILSSILNVIPEPRVQLLGIALVGFVCFLALEVRRIGSFFRVVYLAAVFHILRAVVFGESGVVLAFEDRLTGGISPVFMGFESVVVLGTSLYFWSKQKFGGRIFLVAVMGSCLFVLMQSQSRAAWVSLIVAMCLVYITRPWRNIFAGIASVFLCLSIVLLSLLPSWRGLSSAEQRETLTATGRSNIWGAILSTAERPWTGYGFAALRDEFGSDRKVFQATLGLPAENALLNAYMMAGLLGFLILLATFARLIVLLFDAGRKSGVALPIWMIAPLIINLALSGGFSGPGFQWWWLFALISLLRVMRGYPLKLTGALSSASPSRASPSIGCRSVGVRRN